MPGLEVVTLNAQWAKFTLSSVPPELSHSFLGGICVAQFMMISQCFIQAAQKLRAAIAAATAALEAIVGCLFVHCLTMSGEHFIANVKDLKD